MGNGLFCVTDKTNLTRIKSIQWNVCINREVPSGETLLTIAAQDGIKDLVVQLIDAGANVNQTNQNGSPPLHAAIRAQREDVVEILLEHTSDVNMRDRSGLTPLHLACVTQNEHIIRKLLKAGANPDGVMDGKFYVSTPLMIVAENKNDSLARVLLQYGAGVNKRDWWQYTALLKAVQVGSKDLVQLLLSHGADPNVTNRFGGSALQYASMADHCEIVRLLIKAGCRINSRCRHGDHAKDSMMKHSSIAASIHRGCVECFHFFLEQGVDVNEEDSNRKTPLIYALTNRLWDCNNYHHRYVPQCTHSSNPSAIDSTRISFARELIDRGAGLYPVWDCVIWQTRYMYVHTEDKDALILAVCAMGFIHREGFKVETFYRTMALSAQWEVLWLLFLAGHSLTDEDLRIAFNKLHAGVNRPSLNTRRRSVCVGDSEYRPDYWMRKVRRAPRFLRNICVIKIRECLSDNVLYKAEQLKLSKTLCRLITLDLSPVSYYDDVSDDDGMDIPAECS